ncbi:DUF5715 family protein [Porphyromonas sp.]|uniref:DUF5715 family protein n=1 Tax=Porphyromonas sp. TaxID=1924944 RepID=UPI0026DD7CE7|nr:DUF5715 family protein [Porphyromonas sp.]MDO4771814.1 DUF5715 family protein [Porphyromonas sp.]
MDIGQNTETNDVETAQAERIVSLMPLFTRYIIPLVLVTLIGVLWLRGYLTIPESRDSDPLTTMVRSGVRYQGSFARDFNDLNDLQLEAARRIGISPLESREGLDKVLGKLKEVHSNGDIHVDPLKHSVPYLVPEARTLLYEIGKRFTQILRDKDLPKYLPIVTSVTRTRMDIKSLQHGNGNATDNSTHLYGTTFDISWSRYKKADKRDERTLSSDELKHILAIVLAELKKDGRCYIKHEVKQACFHITTRP